MKNINEKYLKTSSFDLTSYLLSKQCELSGVEKDSTNNGKLIFCFFDTDQIRNLVNDYYSLRALVRPQEFINAERTLRSIIRSRTINY